MSREPNQQFIKFSEGFKDANREDWTRLVEESLKGNSLGSLFGRSTYEGFKLEPVYGGAVDEGGAGRDAHATFISKIRERANAFPSHAGWN